MGFLDNLENNLKSLENLEERDGAANKRRDAEREAAKAAAPWAQKLRTSPYTQRLLDEAAAAGQRERAKLHIAWLGSMLRLDLRTRRLELRPTSTGIVAAFLEGTSEVSFLSVDLDGNPEDLIREWLGLDVSSTPPQS